MAKEVINEVTNEVAEEVINEVANEANVEVTGYQSIIKKLKSNGCKLLSGLMIKNVNYTEEDNYTRVSFILNRPIRGYVTDDNGETWKEGVTNIVFTSLYGIVGALKEDEELSWMSNALLNNPKILNMIFCGATINILQQDVVAGEEYSNPFSTRNDAPTQIYDHDIIINHIIKFKLNKTGEKMADKLADKLMGDI
jgi:hypothetical protein